jgi:muramoyltetrapeptide carboxypeptidase
LRLGDLVGIAAPAGHGDPAHLRRGLDLLEGWGLRVEPPPPASPRRYLWDTEERRARHLAELLRRPDIAAILTVRGGYGCSRLSELFDPASAVSNPKIFAGFSDVSLLLSRMVAEAGMLCFHGPMVGADLPRLTAEQQERFRAFLFDEPGWFDGRHLDTWQEGQAEGRLAGGCLSVLVTTLGTPYEIDTDGAVLFLEDVTEKPYRIDRMLTHLRHAGKLSRAAGIVLGAFEDCDDGQGPQILREVIMDIVGDLGVPVAAGLDAGHGSGNMVVPIGCRARLHASARGAELELLESPFERP